MKNLNLNFANVTFLDNEHNLSLDESDVVLFGVAFDLTASYKKGTWFGPQAILNASYQIEYETPVFSIPLTEKIKIHNAGILEYVRESSDIKSVSEQMVSDVCLLAKKVFDKNKFLMVFGGEHSITNGIFQAISKKELSKDITVVQIDAHLDLRAALEDMKLSHGSVMRRAKDAGFNLVQVGIRDHVSAEERKFIEKTGQTKNIFWCATQPKEFYMTYEPQNKNLIFDGEITEEMTQRICSLIKTKKVWLSFDIDALDSGVISGTGTPLPHGLSLSSVEKFLYKLIVYFKTNDVQLVGFDLNEVSPELVKNEKTYVIANTATVKNEMIAALLAYKILFWNFVERFAGVEQ